MVISKRTFVSFDELCPYQCKFCFSYGITRDRIRTTEEIVNSISNDDFDVIYVSQKNDNFANPFRGLTLCQQLFRKYTSNLFIITRNVLSDDEITELGKLKSHMLTKNRHMFVAISLNALASINLCENENVVCTPEERIDFIKRLANKGFMPILMLRPVFPDSIIPVGECLQIIEQTHQYISCVVSSGLGINSDILKRLSMKESDFIYNECQDYLQGAIDCDIKFVNVDYEIKQIYEKCSSLNVAIFDHSMPALNYILKIIHKSSHMHL